MLTKSSLAGGAAIGVLLAASLATGVYAKPTKHHHHAAAAAAPTNDRAEIDALKAEVASLDAWRQQETADRQSEQQQTQGQMDELHDQLEAAQGRADHAEALVANQIQTIPGAITTEVAKQTPKPGWWANTTISGRMYYDLTNINETTNNGNAGLSLGSAATSCSSVPCTPLASGDLGHSPNGVNFDIKRMYISVDHTFSPMFSSDFTTDFLYDYATKSTQLYIKKAYLQIKLSDLLIFQVGSADQPWVPFVEDAYGYRYVENTLIDRTKFGTSADWGMHVQGKAPVGPATLAYNVAVTNGMGYKVPGFTGGTNRSSTMDFEGRASVTYKGLVAGVGGYYGKLGADYAELTTVQQTAERFDALVAYSDKWFRIGGEYMWSRADAAGQITTSTADNSFQYSVFGNVNLTPQISIFGRYDWVRPMDNSHPTLLNDYYNFGISYEPVKIVDFALVYKHDSIENGAFGDQNFTTVAVSGKPATIGTYDEIGLFGQFRW